VGDEPVACPAVTKQVDRQLATDAAGWVEQACGDVACGLSAATAGVDDAVQAEDLAVAVDGVAVLEAGDVAPLGGHGCPDLDGLRMWVATKPKPKPHPLLNKGVGIFGLLDLRFRKLA
jgi:hypothetical protein